MEKIWIIVIGIAVALALLKVIKWVVKKTIWGIILSIISLAITLFMAYQYWTGQGLTLPF